MEWKCEFGPFVPRDGVLVGAWLLCAGFVVSITCGVDVASSPQLLTPSEAYIEVGAA